MTFFSKINFKTRGLCIYRSPRGIRVLDNGFYRVLKFQSKALQTVLNKARPQKTVLEYIAPFVLPAQLSPGDTCLLGLGGAACAHALAPFVKDYTLKAVEIDEEVIQLAEDYFFSKDIKPLEIIHAEANAFVFQEKRAFQHILIDVFDAFSFPRTCSHEMFFLQCKQLLLPTGILAINLAQTLNHAHEQYRIFHFIKKAFPNATLTLPIKNSSNIVVFASKTGHVENILKALAWQNTEKLRKLQWDKTWGHIAKFN